MPGGAIRMHGGMRSPALLHDQLDYRSGYSLESRASCVKVALTKGLCQGILDSMTSEFNTSHMSPAQPDVPTALGRTGRTHHMTLYGIREEQPGPRWQALYDATREGYHRWYLSEGEAARPDLRTS